MSPAGSHPWRADIERLAARYDGLVREHGTAPAAAQWSDEATEAARMEVLAEVGDLRQASVLDCGCSTGSFLAFLSERGFSGSYTGYDIAPEAIATARRRFPAARFEVRDILSEAIDGTYDYVVVGGVFNNRIADNWGLLTQLLTALFAATRIGLAFNALSTYVDYADPELYYLDPLRALRFCKEELSPAVTLRHDYEIKPGVVPFEFTVYVYRSALAPRSPLSL